LLSKKKFVKIFLPLYQPFSLWKTKRSSKCNFYLLRFQKAYYIWFWSGMIGIVS
jgi:hypothetical protein